MNNGSGPVGAGFFIRTARDAKGIATRLRNVCGERARNCDVTTTDGMPAPETKGLVMHSEARYYDLLAWVLTLGRERPFRERVGASGVVRGIDASPEMSERAKRKAGKASVDVVFQTAVVEALPFPRRQL